MAADSVGVEVVVVLSKSNNPHADLVQTSNALVR
jgi:hypothetical protein